MLKRQISNFGCLSLTRRCAGLLCLVALLLSGCSDDKKTKTVMIDDEPEEEALPMDETDDSQLPSGAEELFDDFVVNFASNERLQRRRIVFPLKVKADGKMHEMDSLEWEMQAFFMNDDGYIQIFDTPQQMERVSDTTVNRAIVERISFDSDSVHQFLFSRTGGRWRLDELHWERLAEHPDAAFLSFYRRFAADSLFQQKSLAAAIEFAGPDPDDDFGRMEGFITPGSWEAFAPELPQGTMYNIVYGEPNGRSNQKIFVMKGVADGDAIELTFKQKRGRWRLTKLTE